MPVTGTAPFTQQENNAESVVAAATMAAWLTQMLRAALSVGDRLSDVKPLEASGSEDRSDQTGGGLAGSRSKRPAACPVAAQLTPK